MRLTFSLYTRCLHSVGFGDICPADTDAQGKMFLLTFVLASLGFFCGPVLQLGAAWRHAIPGGLTTVGSVVLGMGVTVFSMSEGLDQFDALYASIITGTYVRCEFRWLVVGLRANQQRRFCCRHNHWIW